MEHTWDLLIHVESGREPSLGWSWSNAIRGWLLFSLPSWPRKVTRDGAKDSRTKPQKMVGYICIINKKNMHCVKTTNHIYIPQYIITLYIYPYMCVFNYSIFIYLFKCPSLVALRMKGRYSKGPRCSHEGSRDRRLPPPLNDSKLAKKHSKGDYGTPIEIHIYQIISKLNIIIIMIMWQTQ
jgi:hypothetical protein